MIVTILPSSATFHAVAYNQKKVAQGKAELLEMSNFDMVTLSGKVTTEKLQDYLATYSSRNEHIRNAQFHVSISCKGREYSFAELVEIAHQYLHEMGYDMDGQPVLIYGHHDTDNNHIHIITSRVAPDGHKINHQFEKKRSIEVMDRIMNKNLHVSENVAKALSYHYESVSQFKAILESEGYECYEGGDTLKIKYSGNVCDEIKIATIEEKKAAADKSFGKQKRLKALLLKYRDHSSNKEELAETMHRYFCISLVFFGKADSPYGYFIIDHANKRVLKGSSVITIKELMKFRSAEEQFKDIYAMVASMMSADPHLTTKDLNSKLKRLFGTRLSKDGIRWGDKTHQLSAEVMTTLETNDRLAWLQSFNPSSEVECSILYRFGKIDSFQGLQHKTKGNKKRQKAVGRVRSIMDRGEEHLKDNLFEAGMRIYRQNGQYYCVDIQDRCIFNMKEHGLDITMLNHIYNNVYIVHTPQEQSKPMSKGNMATKTLTQQGGAGDENREYEVGSKEGYEESIANESRMTR